MKDLLRKKTVITTMTKLGKVKTNQGRLKAKTSNKLIQQLLERGVNEEISKLEEVT